MHQPLNPGEVQQEEHSGAKKGCSLPSVRGPEHYFSRMRLDLVVQLSIPQLAILTSSEFCVEA